jgi:hypothetical protein
MHLQKYSPFFWLKSPLFNKSIPISKEKQSQNFLKGFPLSKEKQFQFFSRSELISKAIAK